LKRLVEFKITKDEEYIDDLLLLMNDNYKDDVILDLIESKNRKVIKPIIANAITQGMHKNGIHFYALKSFNCEEYLKEILTIGLESGFEARNHIMQILFKTKNISYNNKKMLLLYLKKKHNDLITNVYLDISTVCFIEDSIEVINNIKISQSAKIIKIDIFRK
jgi:hypothetical protein